jgi:divalent metal cation (Fe/Co/Zn/Cd) transporter
MKKIIGIFLLLLAVYLGYTGITKFSDSSSSVDILGVELKAEDNQQKNTAYIFIGFAVIAAIGGIALVRSDSK